MSTTLSVTKPENQTRCLQTPAANAASPVYPRLQTCVAGQANQIFVRTTQTSDYVTSYLIVDVHGRCLGRGPEYTPDNSPLTSVVVEACSGALSQKWNAPPNVTASGQTNTGEVRTP